MKRIRLLPLLLALVLLLSACGGQQRSHLERTADYLEKMVPEPGFGSMAGDWIVFGLARSGEELPKGYLEACCKNVEDSVRSVDGRLAENTYTEYSRLILAWIAIGRDPRDVGGYDLLVPLADQKRTEAQGVNDVIFALLALDCGGYEIPENPEAEVQATREGYLAALLDCQNNDGGWNLGGGSSDPDLAAMALQVLAAYRSREEVSQAVERALLCLEGMQLEDGGFARLPDGESAPIATTQAFYALAAIERFQLVKRRCMICQML